MPFLPIAAGLLGAGRSYLEARSARNNFEDLRDSVLAALEPGALRGEYQQLRGLTASARTGRSLALSRQARTRALAQRARLGRAGLSDTTIEAATGGVETGAAIRSAELGDAMDLELLQEAVQNRNTRISSLLALSQVPGSTVSPASAALAGGGYGLEAAQQARFADILAGRFGQSPDLSSSLGSGTFLRRG